MVPKKKKVKIVIGRSRKVENLSQEWRQQVLNKMSPGKNLSKKFLKPLSPKWQPKIKKNLKKKHEKH